MLLHHQTGEPINYGMQIISVIALLFTQKLQWVQSDLGPFSVCRFTPSMGISLRGHCDAILILFYFIMILCETAISRNVLFSKTPDFKTV